MTLQSFTDSLPTPKQFELAIKLIRLASPIWEKYADENELTYTDEVVFIKHTVDRKILSRTVEAVEEHLRLDALNTPHDNKLGELQTEFLDPIVALQDTDWEVPDPVKKTFYSVHNLLQAATGVEETPWDELTIYVSINQSADALHASGMMTFDEINVILMEFKKGTPDF